MLTTDESFSPEREKEDIPANTCLPHLRACGKESTVSYGVNRHQTETCSQESAGPTIYGHSSSASEGRRQRHALIDSDDKPKVTCICDKAETGYATVHQCNNTGKKPWVVCDATSGHKRNMQSHGEECSIQEQSTSLHTEAETHQPKKSAPCQTVCRCVL